MKEVFPADRIGVRLSPNGVIQSMGSEDNFDMLSAYGKEGGLAYCHVMDGLGFDFHAKYARVKLIMTLYTVFQLPFSHGCVCHLVTEHDHDHPTNRIIPC